MQALRESGTAAATRVGASAPGKYWSELTAVDFMNSSFAFAALAVICAFPFLAVISAVTGGDVRHAIIVRMGLNARAARDVNGLISSGQGAVTTLTVFSALLLVVGAVGMASTLQAWYARIYDSHPSTRILTRLTYQAAGVVAFCVYIVLDVLALDAARSAGGRVLVFVVTLGLSVLFWWVSAYFLLLRSVRLRQLLPAGVATGLCITGLGVFSALFFSDEVTSGQRSYGAAGVVLAVTSYLVGFGVCLHLGAVFGRMWNDWRAATASGRDRAESNGAPSPTER
jgi:membrane protein